MSTRFVTVDRETPMLLPVDLREWVPAEHIVHFILDAVETLDLQGFRINVRGTGSEQYPPGMMLSLLVYCYATGRFSSREIEVATHSDVAVRYICGGEWHPDHDTICTFRRENRALFEECFVKVLAYAGQTKVLKKVGGISVDGSKIAANASKHAAVSYDHATRMIAELEKEVRALTAKAEAADNTPLEDGLSVPQEIARRQERKAKLEEAKRVIEARFAEKQREAEAQKPSKRQRKNRPPPGKDQFNFTDPESRIMKTADGFQQSWNAQAAVDTEGSLLIVGQRVTEHGNDKQELVPTVQTVDPTVRQVSHVLTDSGFYSESAVAEVEKEDGPTVYAAMDRQAHHRSVQDLEKKPEPRAPRANAPVDEQMRYRLRTKAGRALYALRKQTVEPVFGIIKEVMGFRRFRLRGRAKVSLEWTLVTLAYNFRRLYRLIKGEDCLGVGWMRAPAG
jgi:transposase